MLIVVHNAETDTGARPIRYAGITMSPEIAELVRAKLETFITI